MPHCRTCGKETSGPAIICRMCAESQNPDDLDGNGIPKGVSGWSWGAFLLNWIWAIGNRTWIGLLALIPYVGLIMAIVLGVKGREWAWKNREWESLEHFNRVQRKWSIWGVALVVGVAGLGIVAALSIPAYMQYVQRTQFQTVVDTLTRGQPILVEYLRKGGSAPMDPAVMAQIHALGVANPVVKEMDAYAVQNYADVGARVGFGSEAGTIYLVTTDGGASWNCRTTFARLAESARCEAAENLERPPVVERYGLWERPYAQTVIDGCVASMKDADEATSRAYCDCVVDKIARQVPQGEMANRDAPLFTKARDLAAFQCSSLAPVPTAN